NKNGLLMKSRGGDRRTRSLCAVRNPSEISPRLDDVVFLAVKSAQTAAAVQSLRETFPEETTLVRMQNGVRNEELAARRFLRVYGGMLGISATTPDPGVVVQTQGNLISIGNYPLGCDAMGAQIADHLTKAGFRTTTHESIMAVKW